MYCEETDEYYEDEVCEKSEQDEWFEDDCRERARDMQDYCK
jgi:hypothetical protein